MIKLLEILKRSILIENDINDLLNAISSFNPNDSSQGINIGSNVAVIKYGPGVITDIDEKNKQYTVKLLSTKKEIKVRFNDVQPAQFPEELPIAIQNNLKELYREYLTYQKNVITNITQDEEDFAYASWKLPNIVEHCLDLGKQLWEICKKYPKAVLHSDEFEELFLEILGDLKVINKLDKNSNKELSFNEISKNKCLINVTKLFNVEEPHALGEVPNVLGEEPIVLNE